MGHEVAVEEDVGDNGHDHEEEVDDGVAPTGEHSCHFCFVRAFCGAGVALCCRPGHVAIDDEKRRHGVEEDVEVGDVGLVERVEHGFSGWGLFEDVDDLEPGALDE